MVLLWILVPVFVFIVGPVNLVQNGGNWGLALLTTFGNLWSGLFIAAGIITLVFAIVERTNAHLGAECKWDPLKLPAVRKDERKPSLLKAVCAGAGDAGAQNAVLNATPDGKKLYETCGFKQIGEGITWWLHPAE